MTQKKIDIQFLDGSGLRITYDEELWNALLLYFPQKEILCFNDLILRLTEIRMIRILEDI